MSKVANTVRVHGNYAPKRDEFDINDYIGHIFKTRNCGYGMLCRVNSELVTIICLETGNRYSTSHEANSMKKLSDVCDRFDSQYIGQANISLTF